jgi:hypothetical protein
VQPASKGVNHGTEHLSEDHAAQKHTSTSNVPPEPALMHKQHLTMRQSFAKIELENQGLAADQEPSFEAWMHDPGAWGGRAPNVEASTMQPPMDARPCEDSI